MYSDATFQKKEVPSGSHNVDDNLDYFVLSSPVVEPHYEINEPSLTFTNSGYFSEIDSRYEDNIQYISYNEHDEYREFEERGYSMKDEINKVLQRPSSQPTSMALVKPNFVYQNQNQMPNYMDLGGGPVNHGESGNHLTKKKNLKKKKKFKPVCILKPFSSFHETDICVNTLRNITAQINYAKCFNC